VITVVLGLRRLVTCNYITSGKGNRMDGDLDNLLAIGELVHLATRLYKTYHQEEALEVVNKAMVSLSSNTCNPRAISHAYEKLEKFWELVGNNDKVLECMRLRVNRLETLL
jgi:hypothetical protein